MKPKIRRHRIPKQTHINAVGIEFEGAWAKYKLPDGTPAKMGAIDCKIVRKKEPKSMKYDGSVHIDDSEATWKGEIASPPLQIRNIRAWIDKNRPDIVNKSCGTHVHVSVKTSGKYTQLATEEFYEYYLKSMAKWGKKHMNSMASEGLEQKEQFWKRLKGENSYCRKKFAMNEQIHDTGRNGERYTHINYCYGLWKTAEFRMLPAFSDPWLTTSSILETLIIVETFLDNAKEPQQQWEWDTEWELPEQESTIYEETATYQQISQYQGNGYGKVFDPDGWISKRGLKLTGKNIPLDEYVIKPIQSYLIPENIPKATKVLSTARFEKEKNHGNTFQDNYNLEGEE